MIAIAEPVGLGKTSSTARRSRPIVSQSRYFSRIWRAGLLKGHGITANRSASAAQSREHLAEIAAFFDALPELSELSRKRVLVIEDDDICGELAEAILSGVGCIVDLAQTPHAAAIRMAEHEPDLVLMDLHLGTASGLQLIASLRRRSLGADIPVVIVTADRDRMTFSEAVGFTIQGYVLKPYDPRFLIHKVAQAISRTNR